MELGKLMEIRRSVRAYDGAKKVTKEQIYARKCNLLIIYKCEKSSKS